MRQTGRRTMNGLLPAWQWVWKQPNVNGVFWEFIGQNGELKVASRHSGWPNARVIWMLRCKKSSGVGAQHGDDVGVIVNDGADTDWRAVPPPPASDCVRHAGKAYNLAARRKRRRHTRARCLRRRGSLRRKACALRPPAGRCREQACRLRHLRRLSSARRRNGRGR